jgi:hypothetical protein
MPSLSILQVNVILQPESSAIVVFGELANDSQVVVGLLRHKHEESHRIRVAQSRPATTGFYLLVFVGVPDGDYTVEVYESPGIRLAWRTCDVDSSALAVFAEKAERSGKFVPHTELTLIGNPGRDGLQVYQTFAASGSATTNNLPSGTMTPHGGVAVNGTTPNNTFGIWSLQFTALAVSPPVYDLNVNVPGSGPANRSNLIVIPTATQT